MGNYFLAEEKHDFCVSGLDPHKRRERGGGVEVISLTDIVRYRSSLMFSIKRAFHPIINWISIFTCLENTMQRRHVG